MFEHCYSMLHNHIVSFLAVGTVYINTLRNGFERYFNNWQKPEVGKAQLKAQIATSALAEVALRFNVLFWNIAEVALRTEVFKICCALIALRFQNSFQLIAQIYTLNLILFHFDRNIDKCPPFLANYLLFFCLKFQKMRYLYCVVKSQLRKLNCALTWYENAVPQLRCA